MATLKTFPDPASIHEEDKALILSVSKSELLNVTAAWLALGLDVNLSGHHSGGVPSLLTTDGKGRCKRLYFTVDSPTP